MDSKYLRFEEEQALIKTKRWNVVSISRNEVLGQIKWYSNWRQYCFFPKRNTVWNPDCLDDVNEFIRMRMLERKGGT